MRKCYLCGCIEWIEKHHIFGGSRRKASEKYGLTVDLCHFCHNEPPNGVHHNKEVRLFIKQIGQQRFEKEHSRNEFIRIFGKNYLD